MLRVAVSVLFFVLLTLPSGVAQGEVATGDAEVQSRFSLVDARDGSVGVSIAQGASLASGRALGLEGFDIRFDLPEDAEGPVEFYVNGEFLGVQHAPPYVLDGRAVLSLARRSPEADAVRIFAMPDVGYAYEVVFTIAN